MPTLTRPYTAWFDQTTRHFATLLAAKRWIAGRLGRDNTTDDYGIQHLDPADHTVIPDLLGADATPHPADPFTPPPADLSQPLDLIESPADLTLFADSMTASISSASSISSEASSASSAAANPTDPSPIIPLPHDITHGDEI